MDLTEFETQKSKERELKTKLEKRAEKKREAKLFLHGKDGRFENRSNNG